jgi:hypothetical protein
MSRQDTQDKYIEKRNGGSGLKRRSDRPVSSKEKLSYTLIAAMLAGTGVTGVNKYLVDARSDPFSGTEGAALAARIVDLEVDSQIVSAWKEEHAIFGKALSGDLDIIKHRIVALSVYLCPSGDCTHSRDSGRLKSIDKRLTILEARAFPHLHQPRKVSQIPAGK